MGDTLPWSHEIRLPAVPLSASRARAFVCRHLVEHRLTSLVDSARLVASELVTNSILHGTTPFVATLALCGNGVLLTVQDDPARPAPTAPAPALLGRSQLIVDLLSRHWGVTVDRQGSEIVWAYLERANVSVRAPGTNPIDW